MIQPQATPGSSSSAPPARAGGYAAARKVEIRAQAAAPSADASTGPAAGRLRQLLASGQVPRQDVPPGYYLDVRV